MGTSERRRPSAGFTLVELVIVVAILGIIAAIAIPAYSRNVRNARCGRTAAEMRSLSTAFVAYQAAHGELPPDSHLGLPPGMEEFIDPQIWTDGTPLGGTYNWEGPDQYGYAGLSIFQPTEPEEAIEVLDALIDDGDLSTGRFRDLGGRPTLILFDDP